MLQYSLFFPHDSTHRTHGHNGTAGAAGSNVLVAGFSRTEFAATRLIVLRLNLWASCKNVKGFTPRLVFLLTWNIYQTDGGVSTNSLGTLLLHFQGLRIDTTVVVVCWKYSSDTFSSKFLPQRRHLVQICDVVMGLRFFHEVQRAVITFIRNSSLALLTSNPPPAEDTMARCSTLPNYCFITGGGSVRPEPPLRVDF